VRGVGTSGWEILRKCILSQVGTHFDTVLQVLLLIVLALVLFVLDYFLAFAFPESSKFALENELLAKCCLLGNV